MLPRTSMQEQISRAYIRAVSARAGCFVDESSVDFGIDLVLRYLTVTPDGQHRDLGHLVGIQAKATTRAELTEACVRYDLDASAYRDLTARSGMPKILVLYAMPTDDRTWLSSTEDGLVLRRCAYWDWLRGRAPTDNSATVRIVIPRERRFDVGAVQGPLRQLAFKRRLS